MATVAALREAERLHPHPLSFLALRNAREGEGHGLGGNAPRDAGEQVKEHKA